MSALVRADVATVSKFDAMRAAVSEIESPKDASETLNRVEALREAFKRLKGAEDQRIAATRLELALIRRIGQLGGSGMFGVHKRAMCAHLSSLSDDDFEQAMSFVTESTAPIKAYRAWRAQTAEEVARRDIALARNEQIRVEFWERLNSDEGFREAYEESQQRHVEEVAQANQRSSVTGITAQLLTVLDMDDRPFTTRELAQEIVEHVSAWGMDEECEFSSSPQLSELVAEAARGAMRKTTEGDEYPYRRVTFIADGEYMHIPWHIATVDHVTAYAAYAQMQADEMQRKADRVREVADHYLSTVGTDPRNKRVVDLPNFTRGEVAS